MAYNVELSATAEKQMDKLSANIQRRIIEELDRLAENPRHTGTRKMTGEEGLHRARVGDYRVVYRIEDNRLMVLVVKIGHRREVYR